MKIAFRRTFMICISIISICLSLSACRKKEQEPEQPVTYKKTEISLPGATEPSKVSIGKDTVYYTINNNKEENTAETVMAFGMDTQTAEELKISLEAGEKVLRMLETEDNQLILLTYVDQNNALTFYLSKYHLGDLESSADVETEVKGNQQEWRTDITKVVQDRNIETNFQLAADETGIYLLDGFYYMLVWNEAGEYQFALRSDDLLQGIVRAGDGMWAYISGREYRILHAIDMKKQAWGKTLDKNLPNNGNPNGFSVGEDETGRILINTGLTLQAYDIGSSTAVEQLNWMNYDVVAADIYAWRKQGDGYRCITTDGQTVKLVLLTPATEEELQEMPEPKQVITMNEEGTYGEIALAVREFNNQSDKYMVQIVEGSGGNLPDSVSKRDVEILAGKATDIICMSYEQEYRKYAGKGILEDLYTYIDADEETKREDYLTNICKIYERNGKLCGMIPSFGIHTVMVPTRFAGDSMAVTIDEFKDMVIHLPQDKKLSPTFINKYFTFNEMLRRVIAQFIDYENYTCDFDSEEFISWIAFVDTMEIREDIDSAAQFKLSDLNEKDYVLGTQYINDETAGQQKSIAMGENITFMGYPGCGKCGSYISNATVLGIWSQSQNKEGAWEFIKFLLSEEEQRKWRECEPALRLFPVRVSTIEYILARAMEPEYEVDETGKRAEVPKGEVNLWSGDKIPYYAASEEDMDKMRKLLTSVEISNQYNEELEKLIMEEVASFYEGDKSAEETAKVIQNRVQLYLDEIKP